VDGEVPEPGENDKVEFELENVSDAVCGVVLKLNGENTIYHERFDAEDCFKWILQPGQKVKVNAFQDTPNSASAFRITSSAESQADEVNYGPYAGSIQVTAFRGKLLTDGKKPAPPVQTSAKEEDRLASAAVSRGSIKFTDDDNNPAKSRPDSLGALQEQLKGREKTATDGRGMIKAGAATEREVKKVTFEADPPTPVMNYTIQYYKPKRN
jgi:hypothetical protein